MELQRYRETHPAWTGAGEPEWLHQARAEALARFQAAGLPTTRLEAWKYSNPIKLGRIAFRHDVAESQASGAPGIAGAIVLHFVNGRLDTARLDLSDLPDGVQISSLSEALTTRPAFVRSHLGHYAPDAEADRAFTSFNLAFMQDGAVVELAGNVALQRPLHLVFESRADHPVAAHPRNLVVLGENSRAEIIEEYVGGDGEPTLTNRVTEAVLASGSHLEHILLQREGVNAHHIGTTFAEVGRDATFLSRTYCLGGAFLRNDLQVHLGAPGGSCELNGLYLGGGKSHLDNHTCIDHHAPNCTSRELYKGVLGGESRAVFNGRVLIRRGAQRSDSAQANHNLLLTDKVEIDTKPELEIYADDVKAAHGTTVGQLDPDQIFYLRARGIGEPEARQMLTEAFAAELTAQAAENTVGAHLRAAVSAKLNEVLENA